MQQSGQPGGSGSTQSRYPDELVYAAAALYYQQEKKQADVATELGTSRATVSRLLDEARRRGIVQIHVIPPRPADGGEIARRAADALGVDDVHLCPPIPAGSPGAALASGLAVPLGRIGLRPGDVMLVSSGRTVHAVSRSALPSLPGVVVVPTIGGHDEPQSWYQPNEIVRQFAARVGGVPRFIFAPALPSAALYDTLMTDPSVRDVLDLWSTARCAVLGVGAAPLERDSLPKFVTPTNELLASVGDVCSRFYDQEGTALPFPGSDHLVAITLDALREVPTRIAVAYGVEKIPALRAGAGAGYFNELVTDVATAAEIAP